jgi:uncharacterized protein HemX
MSQKLGAFPRSSQESQRKRNQSGTVVVMGIVVVIAVAIAIVIGYIVLVQVVNNVPANTLNSAQSTQLSNISGQITNAFVLTTVLPVVLVASLIIGGFLTFFSFRRQE